VASKADAPGPVGDGVAADTTVQCHLLCFFFPIFICNSESICRGTANFHARIRWFAVNYCDLYAASFPDKRNDPWSLAQWRPHVLRKFRTWVVGAASSMDDFD
jgi:hypothetical protein